MARRSTHKDVDFEVDDASGKRRNFKTWAEASAFAISVAASRGESRIDAIVWSESGARWLGGDWAVEQYREDPEASVFNRYEIRVNNVGRVS